jgi:multidrug efflux pump subunit AcrA (membrane-fusion protein)
MLFQININIEERVMHTLLKSWSLWVLIAIAVLFACGIAGDFLNFPLGLALLRVVFLVAEQIWPRLRVETEQPTLKLS